MNLARNAQKMCSYLLKCLIKTNPEIVDFLILIIGCLFPIGRVGTYRQVLHLFIKTITVCRKLQKKVYCN